MPHPVCEKKNEKKLKRNEERGEREHVPESIFLATSNKKNNTEREEEKEGAQLAIRE